MVTPPLYDPNYCPFRGHVVWIDFTPQEGKEIWDWRPALVLSAELFNSKKEMAVVCPITRTSTGSCFEIKIPNGIKSKTYPDEQLVGVVRADQVKSLDWKARRARFLCGMPEDIVWKTASMVHAMIWGEQNLPIPETV